MSPEDFVFIFEGFHISCFVLLNAPGKASLKFLEGGLVDILDDGFLFCSGHNTYFSLPG
jgi:hypothetical protein